MDLYKLRVPIPFELRDGQKVYKRSDLWRLRYRVQRYLSYLSMSELEQRNKDIWINLVNLTEAGQIGLPPIEPDGVTSWMERWTHLIEEYGLRGTGMAAGFLREVALPKPTAPLPAKGTLAFRARGIVPKGRLIKFGNQKWLEDTWTTGNWRLAPATFYESETLCDARRDSEMELSIRVPIFKRHPLAEDQLNDEFPDSIAEIKWLDFRAKTDYYLACFSRSLVHRFFDDFSADCCLVVLDEARFKSRMMGALEDLHSGWLSACENVEYVDPALPLRRPNIFFAKHFRYSYQEEFRFVLAPKQPMIKLPTEYLHLGSLKDCCESFR